MFGSEILEVAIGLIFVYILLSLFCSTVAFLAGEVSTTWISKRSVRALPSTPTVQVGMPPVGGGRGLKSSSRMRGAVTGLSAISGASVAASHRS